MTSKAARSLPRTVPQEKPMIRVAIASMILALTTRAAPAQEPTPSTWRDSDTRCIYLKVGDTLSLRYRRDGTPDCASVQRDVADTAISRDDFRDLGRSIEALRRDIGALHRAVEDLRRSVDQNAKAGR